MDRVLIIGASGLLGYRTMLLGSEKYEMYGTYNAHKLEGKNLSQLDVTKRSEVNAIIEKIRPNLVVDAHTNGSVDYMETHPDETWDINVTGTRNLAEAAKAVAAKFIYISTALVFDGTKPEYFEADTPNPINYYGKSKWMSELSLKALDVDHIVLRTSTIYGKGGAGKTSFIPLIVDTLRKNEKIDAISDQSLNPTFVDRLIEAMFGLYERDAAGIFHVVDKECMSKYDMSVIAARVFGLDEKLIAPTAFAKMGMKAKRPATVNMNSEKVERETGIKMLSVKEGLKIFKRQMESESL